MATDTTVIQDYRLTLTQSGSGWSYEWTTGDSLITSGWHRGNQLEAKLAAYENLTNSIRYAPGMRKPKEQHETTSNQTTISSEDQLGRV